MGGFLSHSKPEKNQEVLNASCGPIRGNIYKHGEKIIDGYLGIPYAKPPVGDLQFKKPVAVETWNEPLDCHKYGPGCPTSGIFSSMCHDWMTFDEEKCLNLNVFAPRWKSNEFVKLYRRFYAMSGTAYCTFLVRSKEDEAHACRVFTIHYGYSGNDSTSSLNWYQSQDVSIFKNTTEIQRDFSSHIFFVPNFDGDFFPKPFDELRKEAPKLDAMVTIGEYEGLGMMFSIPACSDPNHSLLNLKACIADSYIPEVTRNHEEVQKKLFDFYTKDIDVTDKAVVARKLVEFLSDYLFNKAVVPPQYATFPFQATTHGSDAPYVFGDAIVSPFNPTEEQLKVMDMMGQNPNGKNCIGTWEKYNLNQPNGYFKIDYPKCEMRDNFQNGRLEIYKEIEKDDVRYRMFLLN
ncbi:Protein CBG06781 [Caenorhabditis briggsae]|uniref:Protein CBG06781 n=1 Tax=Caenorhabditis briggsae TaxID=6238 RepID=A8X323_CAEBR|nr:Protein CBG06781 [Caenorhabditis briggsae]CAP27033.2 Protein CBG06781 [Caenorhabditis briggsae]